MTTLDQLSYQRQRTAEELFAATVYSYPVYSVKTCGWLTPSTLITETIRDFWVRVLDNISPSMPDDQAQIEVIQAAAQAGITVSIAAWQRDIGFIPMPEAYAGEISRRAYIARTVPRTAQLAASLARGDDKEARRIIQELAGDLPETGNNLPNALVIHEKFIQALRTGNRIIETFIPPIDESLGGLERQTLTILAGRPSMGKTALALQIARNQAAAGHRVLFSSLEMSDLSLWARMACPAGGTTWRDIKSGKATPEQIDKTEEESKNLADLYGDNLIIQEKRIDTETLWKLAAENKPDLVVADHLGLFTDKCDSEVQRLGNVTQRMKDIAKGFNCAALLLSQLSRKVEDRQDKRPVMSDLRDSGKIEENADVILMMYREDYYTGERRKQSPTEVLIRKFRDGPQNGRINLMFDQANEWFERGRND